MFRRVRHDWFLSLVHASRRRAKSGRTTKNSFPLHRRLRIEPLEDRRLLAGVVVGNSLDVVNGNTVSIANLIADNGGDGISLREAILAANATAGADVVTFAPALSGQTITLGGTELAIPEALTIDARSLATNVTINANHLSRIFNITATTGDFTLGGLTLTGGRFSIIGTGRGGAILSLTTGNLTIDQSTVSGNLAGGLVALGGGISANGNVTLTRSTVSGNAIEANFDPAGGGIHSLGAVTLTQSTVSGNSIESLGEDGYGGGISANGNVTLTLSTVSGNSVTADDRAFGGGIRSLGAVMLTQSTVSGNVVSGNSSSGAEPNGGGINSLGDVTLMRSTVSGNVANSSSAGGIAVHGAVTITQSTVTDNSSTFQQGGGVVQADSAANHPFVISGSIVAGNTATIGGPDVLRDSQSTLTVNYSVIGTGVAPTAGGNNIVTNVPQLLPLADNGGPTLPHATLATSPAINAGDPTIAPNPTQFDQRGAPFVRVFGGRMDAGAYERQTLAGPIVVDASTDTSDGDYSAGNLSLREAISFATGSIGPDIITFAPALSGATITLGGTELVIPEALTIDARPLAANVTINANQLSRVFNITATTGDFTFGGLNLTGSHSIEVDLPGRGGAVRSVSTGNLTIDQSTISGNSTTDDVADGGGVYARGNLTLTNSTVSGNTSPGSHADGAGIYSLGAVTLLNSTVSGNSAGGWAGGIWGQTGITLTGSTVNGNTAVVNAGGLGSYGPVSLTRSTASGNSTIGNGSTSGNGGGIWTNHALTLMQSTIAMNHANFMGGGVFQADSPLNHPLTISGSIVAGNTTLGGGADLVKDPQSALTVNYSLIGTGVVPSAGGNNVPTNNPLLGPLANNGGLTQTHTLLAGSPAINAGDPSIVFNPAAFDQRGAPYVRVSGGRIDIGAFEVQPAGPALPGDYNQNNVVDAADYVVWRKTLGTTGLPQYSGADGDGNGAIGQGDYNIWRANFGRTLGSGSGESAAASRLASMPAKETESQPSLILERQESAANTATTDEHLPTSRSAFRKTPAILGLFTQIESHWTTTSNLASSAPVAATHDDALLAWLASRDLDQTDAEEKSSIRPDATSANDADQDASNESLDAAFASLALGG